MARMLGIGPCPYIQVGDGIPSDAQTMELKLNFQIGYKIKKRIKNNFIV